MHAGIQTKQDAIKKAKEKSSISSKAEQRLLLKQKEITWDATLAEKKLEIFANGQRGGGPGDGSKRETDGHSFWLNRKVSSVKLDLSINVKGDVALHRRGFQNSEVFVGDFVEQLTFFDWVEGGDF